MISFNVFGKSSKSSDELVLEIHDAFDKAEEKILAKAAAILSTNVELKLVDKAERLSKLGFINTSIVNEANKEQSLYEAVLRDKKNATDEANLIKTYQREYPYLKFLTEELKKKMLVIKK